VDILLSSLHVAALAPHHFHSARSPVASWLICILDVGHVEDTIINGHDRDVKYPYERFQTNL